MTMQPYRPQISCAGRIAPPVGSCSLLLSGMANHRAPEELFGRAGDTRPTIPLPYTLAGDDERCMFVIDSSDRRVTTASWFELWEASTALVAKCLRFQKKAGRIGGLGANRKMYITIFDE